MSPFKMEGLAYISVAIILVLNILVVLSQNVTEEVVLDAGELGKIRGAKVFTMAPNRRSYYIYFNLPYAKPPTKSQRFRPSERRVGNLSGTDQPFPATFSGASCNQALPIPQSENCLSLTISTPRSPNSADPSLLPVIFFIHGGAFTVGMGTVFNGYRLLSKDVVLVSINYRLGALGFLYFGTEDVPGNAGLYDMVNALTWTRDHIKAFGGDPDRVTIAGQSSGSVAVSLLLSSPLTKGLFIGAICNSGSSLAKWGIAKDPINSSLRVAELSGCYRSSEGYPDNEALEKITNCMRSVRSKVLVDAVYQYQVDERKEGRLGFDPASAVVQSFAASDEFTKVLVKHPKDVFEDGEQVNVPAMMGTTRHDGSYPLGILYNRYLVANNYHNDKEYIRKKTVAKILEALDINSDYGVIKGIENMYFGDTIHSGNFSAIYPGFIDVLSVFFFKGPGYQTALFHSHVNETYWYSFDFKGRHTMFYLSYGLDYPPFRGGIGHGDDLIYLFQTSLDLNVVDTGISQRMIDYWVNFATYGSPTVNKTLWPPLNDSDPYPVYMSIGHDSTLMKNYENSWTGIGWEVLPSTPSPITATSESSNNDENANKGGSITISFNYYLTLVIIIPTII